MCARECPDHLIQIVPARAKVYVACTSTDKGAYTRKVCKNGCIGCMKCQKTCEYEDVYKRQPPGITSGISRGTACATTMCWTPAPGIRRGAG